MFRFGERFGHEGRLPALGPPFAEALGRFGHVVAPLRLVELHLLLRVCQEGEVGEGLLLAEVGGRRRGPTVHAARLEDLQLSSAGLGHPAAWRLGPLGHHAFALACLLSEAPEFVGALAAAQFHLGLQALEGGAQHPARQERIEDPELKETSVVIWSNMHLKRRPFKSLAFQALLEHH
uniref:Uncharacterized protein n=1 Tax=Monodelphis domestica TaxID=13616 RepID=A0A5F8G3B6_MONDO